MAQGISSRLSSIWLVTMVISIWFYSFDHWFYRYFEWREDKWWQHWGQCRDQWDPSCTEANDHSSEQASSSERDVDGLVSTETSDLNNTQTDGHNSKGIVDCENVENDKV